jgi:arsenical pump membrane protein
MDSRQWLALAIFLATLALVLARPRRPGEGVVALLGAAAVLCFGLLTPGAAIEALRRNADVLAFFSGLMLTAFAAEQSGVFRSIGNAILESARGNPRRLMVHLFLAGIVVTALFSNDAAILLLTPAVLATELPDGADPAPYALACTFLADAASAILPISNPINLLMLSHHGLSVDQYVRGVTLPGITAALVTLLTFLMLFRRQLDAPPVFPTARPALPAGTDPWLHRVVMTALASQAALYVLFAIRGWPLGAVTLASGIVLALLVSHWQHCSLGRVARSLSWQALGLVLGLLLVVDAMHEAGVTGLAASKLSAIDGAGPIGALLIVGVVVALASNLINNWPAMLLIVSIIGTGSFGRYTEPAATGAVLGAAIGPKLTQIGSLATVLWLALLQERQFDISMRQYVSLAIVVTPAALASALAVAALLLVTR